MTTLLSVFGDRVERCAGRVALHRHTGTAWETTTWREFAEDVAGAAEHLAQTGIGPGDHVVLFSANRYEWLVLDLAILSLRAVHVPLHAALTGAQARYQIEHCDAAAVIVENRALWERLRGAYGTPPARRTWYLLDANDDGDGSNAPSAVLPTLFPCGNEALRAAGKEPWRQAAATLGEHDLATILYTSGTTGEPKGVMLTHGNLASNAVTTAEAFGLELEGVRLNMLPLSHVFARVCDLYMWLVQGCELGLARSRETVIDDLRTLRPSWFNAVPYWFAKFREVLQADGRADEPGALRGLLGGRIAYCCSGGAPLPDHLFDYYAAQGVPILQGYGLTETSPVVSISRPGRPRRGASGQPLRDVQVRLAADGELLVRGPNVMRGYFRDDDASWRAIRGGWFHTGDLAEIDEDGYLRITGRKKELIVTAGGKNIAPVALESTLLESPCIAQAMVVGDRRKYLAALIVPDPRGLRRTLPLDLPWGDWSRCLDDPRLIDAMQQIVSEQLAEFSSYEQVRRIVLLAEPFSIERGELTAKLSLRRDVIAAHYRDRIDALYGETAGESP